MAGLEEFMDAHQRLLSMLPGEEEPLTDGLRKAMVIDYWPADADESEEGEALVALEIRQRGDDLVAQVRLERREPGCETQVEILSGKRLALWLAQLDKWCDDWDLHKRSAKLGEHMLMVVDVLESAAPKLKWT